MQVAQAVFSGAPEQDLLRGFWGAVQPNDLFYGYRVIDLLAQLRRRTWACGMLPSRELDLATVYQHSTVDTAGPRSSTGDARLRSAEALASLLGLPGKIRGRISAACPRLSGVPDALPGGENVHSGLAITRFSGDRLW